MRRAVIGLLLSAAIMATGLAGHRSLFVHTRPGHFFLPPRTLFHFRPDLFVRGRHHHHRGPVIIVAPYIDTGHYGGYGRANYYRGYGYYGRTFYTPASKGIYSIVLNSPVSSEVVRANTSDIIFRVVPEQAHIYVDGRLIGSARDFDHPKESYSIVEGEHQLRIEFPGYQPFETTLEIVPNRTLHLDIELAPQNRDTQH